MAEEENSAVDLPFAAEYAKSGRSSCKSCKGKIDNDSLRLAVMVQSPMFDGKMPNWFHVPCFFGRNRVKTVGDIKDFDKLRWEDQEEIKKKIIPQGEGGVHSADDALLKDYTVDAAKSSRSVCRGDCNEKIMKGSIRVAKKDYDSESARRFGPKDNWYHLDCFVAKREEFEFFTSGDLIPGFKSLSAEDQKQVLDKIVALKTKPTKRVKRTSDINAATAAKSEVPTKKKKMSASATPAATETTKEMEQLKEQNKMIYKYRDQLRENLAKKDLQLLLEYNDQGIPSGENNLLDSISDCMAFGALLPCPECKNGSLKFESGSYRCLGNLTEWTKCSYTTRTPKRKAFKVPQELKDEHPFLKKYKFAKRERAYSSVEVKPSSATVKKDETDGSSQPLANMHFILTGTKTPSFKKLKESIKELGGVVDKKITEVIVAVISNQDELDKQSSSIKDAEKAKIPIVKEEFVDAVRKGGNVRELVTAHTISKWDVVDLSTKVKAVEPTKSGSKGGAKNVPTVMKMTAKGGAVVNPNSGLETSAHVLLEKSTFYNAVLGLVDVSRGTNSFYQVQLLESDKAKKYWVFRSWGRIGTSIGGNKLEKMDSVVDAKEHFKALYEEKTGNSFESGDSFVKYPNKFYPIDIDYGQDDQGKSLKDVTSKIKSKLAKSVQDLICMIFDIELMKSAMVEFELDLVKMPLGKLSKRQIEQAYSILTELQKMMDSKSSESRFVDASNRFYTLIPHNFGMKKPPILKTEELIKSKIDMLESLLEIEVAYKLLEGTENSDRNPIDSHYAKLNTAISVLERKSEEFDLLETYLKNTHASTHTQYSLKIRDVFKVNRNGESSRYRPFKKLHNRMLLWHGSRTSNYVGIFSQGLRIAPPEAPVTGYMFGKGIYFADMVSKSANYCHTSKQHPIGLLLLCEVALGDMHELKQAAYVEKLPAGKYSTKGLGATHPNPAKQIVDKNGVIIPLGEGVSSGVTNTSLLYNEYIVYDMAQVNVKYLIEVEFDWKF